MGVDTERISAAIGTCRRRSDDLDCNSVCVCREGLDVGPVTGEHSSTRLGDRDDERVDSRSGPGTPPQLCCSPCCRLAHRRLDDAHLQESVSVCVPPRIAVQGFDEYHRRYHRRPQSLCLECPDQRQRRLGTCRQTRHSAAIEHQHASTDSVERAVPDASCDCIRSGLLPHAGLADLGGEFFEVSVCFGKRVLAFQLGTKRDLQELRGREVALLELFVKIVGQIHLNTGHTSNYTYSAGARPAHLAAPSRRPNRPTTNTDRHDQADKRNATVVAPEPGFPGARLGPQCSASLARLAGFWGGVIECP